MLKWAHIPYILACCHLETDVDPDPDFYLMWMPIRMGIQVTKMMRIHADPDPQHWFFLSYCLGLMQMFCIAIAINTLFEWLFGVLDSRLPPRRPGFDSRPKHVSLWTSSLGWRWPWSSVCTKQINWRWYGSVISSKLPKKFGRALSGFYSRFKICVKT